MKKKVFKGISKLALRCACWIALIVGATGLLLTLLFFAVPLSQVLLEAFILAMIAGIVSYIVINRLQLTRLEFLNRISRNMTQKQFEDYNSLPQHSHDELDYLIKQSVRASRTMEREIHRLNRIENYRK